MYHVCSNVCVCGVCLCVCVYICVYVCSNVSVGVCVVCACSHVRAGLVCVCVCSSAHTPWPEDSSSFGWNSLRGRCKIVVDGPGQAGS